MRIAPVAALALLSLAACGKSGADDVKLENASIAEVTAKTKDVSAEAFRPGQWKTTSHLVSTDMPKPAADQIAKAMVENGPPLYCMSPEEAKNPMQALAKDNGECRFDKFAMTGGKLDGVLRCQEPGQPAFMVMTMNGTYTRERYETNSEMKVTVAGQTKSIKVNSVAERIGECKG